MTLCDKRKRKGRGANILKRNVSHNFWTATFEKNAFDIATEVEKKPEIDADKIVKAKVVKDFHIRKRLASSTTYSNMEMDFRKIIENKDNRKVLWDTLKTISSMIVDHGICTCFLSISPVK